jgi:hypothetical protein
VTHRSAVQRIALVVNILVFVATYIALLTRARWSLPYAVAVAAGIPIIATVSVVPFTTTLRSRLLERRSVVGGPGVRTMLAMAPWIVLVALIAARGLWWTQRPGALRFFAAWTLLNWSIAWCEPSDWSTRTRVPARRAVLLLALLFLALGLEGLAFGVTPFGCALSAVVAGTGILAVAAGFLGTVSGCLKVFAASVAAMLGAGIAEAAVRALHVGQNVQEADSREIAREFYTLTPPRAAFVNNPGVLDEFGPALVEINSLGSRGPEIPDGRADVLLIGDSMVEARQLPWNETVGPRLQEALRARAMPDRVVAHGMRGWSPLLEWNWYLKVGRRLGAKTVLLFFFWNDLWTAGTEAATYEAVLDANGRPAYFDVPVDADWIWYKHVRVVRLAADVWQRLSVNQLRHAFSSMAARTPSSGPMDTPHARELARRLNDPPLTGEQIDALLTTPDDELPPDLQAIARNSFWPRVRPYELWTDAQRKAAAATELELQRFGEDVAAGGGRLVLVHVPNPLQVGPGECAVGRLFERVPPGTVLPPGSGIQTWLQDVAQRQRLELLDPSDAMRQAAAHGQTTGAEPMYLRADCHWTARGHRFMAEYLADWYIRSARR